MRKVLPITAIIALLAVLTLWQLPGVFYNNIGRLVWLRSGEDQVSTAVAALPYFERAIASNPRYPQARIGAALMNILLGNEDAAFAHWRVGGIDSSILIAYGDKEDNDGDYDRALLFYRDSARLANETSSNGHILAGNICQRALYGPGLLSEENKDYCRSYYSDNEDNFFVNANFNNGDLIGWTKRYWSGYSGEYLVEHEGDDESYTAVIQGENNKEVGSLSQHMTFQPGTIVRFSARIKVELQSGANVRLLHAVWTRPDGKPGGNQLATTDEGMEWGYVERTLRVPQAEGGSFTFSPAILTGRGKVWIDDAQLEIIPED